MIKNIVSRCAVEIKTAFETVRRKLSESPLVHCDETGTNIDGKFHWVHNVSNGNYIYMTINKKRGRVKRGKSLRSSKGFKNTREQSAHF